MEIDKIVFVFIVMPTVTAFAIWIINKLYEYTLFWIDAYKDMKKEQKHNPKLRYFLTYLNLLAVGFWVSIILSYFIDYPFNLNW